MELISFINKFAKDDYKLKKASNRWNLEFANYSSFNDKDIIDELNGLMNLDLVSYNGKYKSSSREFSQIDSPTSNICHFVINIKLDKIREYVQNNNKTDGNSINIQFAFDELEYNNFSYNLLNPDKLNILIYKKAENVLNNGFVIISNSVDIKFAITDLLKPRQNFIREVSTILLPKFYLPEFFYFDNAGFDKLPLSFRSGYIVSVLLSICSHSRTEGNTYHCGIKGYKTIAIETSDSTLTDFFAPDNDAKLFQLYNWIFEETKIADVRLGVIRYLLTLDVMDFDGILKKISDVNSLLLSAKHQFELVISGSIKEHFDNLSKANERVKSAVDSIYEQIDKLSSSLNQVIIGILGLIVTLFGKFDQLSPNVKFGYTALLLGYLSYLKFHSSQNILGRKNQILLQFNAFADTLRNQLKIIDANVVEEQIRQPLESADARFEQNYYWVKLIIEVAIVASFLALFLWAVN